MAAEKKTGGVRMHTTASKTLHRNFSRECKKRNISIAQALRDLMQKSLKK